MPYESLDLMNLYVRCITCMGMTHYAVANRVVVIYVVGWSRVETTVEVVHGVKPCCNLLS